MTPTWAVVLVGLAGGLVGSTVATLLTISHERAAEMRSRMLNAADDFSTGAITALQQARNAAGEIKKDTEPLDDEDTGWYRSDIQSCLDLANKAVDEALAKQARIHLKQKQARIHLIFGDQSTAGITATGVVSQLRNMMSALEHRPDSVRDPEAMSMYSRNFEGTLEQHERFTRAARAAFNETWWGRLKDRWQIRRTEKSTA